MKNLILIASILLISTISPAQSFQNLCEKNKTKYTLIIPDSTFQLSLLRDTIDSPSGFFKEKGKIEVSYCRNSMDLIIAFEFNRMYITLPYKYQSKKLKLILLNGDIVQKNDTTISYRTPPKGKF